jgi:DedD protein
LHNLSDRALKERVIGAAVLVILAVLVVPVFLDGPPDDTEIVSESVTLPGQNNQDRKQQTIVLDRERSQPVPATRAPSPAPPPPAAETARQASAAESEAPAQETAAAPAPAAAPPTDSSPTGMWAVQLGSFSNKDNAERLAADLRDQGFAAFLSQLPTDGGQLQRVRVGPQKDRDSAEAVAGQLAKAGHEGSVVPHP